MRLGEIGDMQYKMASQYPLPPAALPESVEDKLSRQLWGWNKQR